MNVQATETATETPAIPDRKTDRAAVRAALEILPAIFTECIEPWRRPGHDKYALDRPFAIDGHVYATDGRILVRMPVTPTILAILPVHPEAKFPKAPGEFARCPWQSEPIAIPPQEDGQPCQDCLATGECCCECCGDVHVCRTCEGSGSDAHLVSVPVGPIEVSEHYLRLLRRHNATLYLPACEDPSKEPARFMVRWEQHELIEGLVMPMAPPKTGA